MNILVTQYVCDNFIPEQLLPVHTKAHIENRESYKLFCLAKLKAKYS